MTTAWIRRFACALCAAIAVAATPATAQPKHERQVFSLAMVLRGQLAQELGEASAETLAEVAGILSRCDDDPLLVLERALAKARGVDADAEFVLRAGLMLFAMPEVVDGERYDAVHLTVHAPYRRELPGRLALHLRVLDPTGEERWSEVIDDDLDIDGLLRYRATTTAPVEGWPDGSYRAELSVWIDGEPPRPTDVRPFARFCVLHGFPERVEALTARVAALERGPMDPSALAAKGALTPLVRIYQGEPPEGDDDPLRELAVAEQVVDNVEADRAPLTGLEGWVTVAVPTGDEEASPVAVRLAAKDVDVGRTLVVFMPGAPAWDARWNRPTSPAATPPGWLRDALRRAGFDAEQRWQLAVMESPGRYHEAIAALRNAVPALRELLRAQGPVVLVGEREGAAAIANALMRDPALAQAAVLVAGGATDPRTAATWSDLAVLGVQAVDHPANENLRRLEALLRDVGGDVTMWQPERSWMLALPSSLPAIQAWIGAHLPR